MTGWITLKALLAFATGFALTASFAGAECPKWACILGGFITLALCVWSGTVP